MNILITGVNGFVGGILAKELYPRNTIVGIGRSEASNCHLHHYYQWDIGTNECPYTKELSDIDVIIHAAACLNCDNNDEQLVITNCVGAFHLFKLAKEIKVTQFFYISSIPIVGTPGNTPIDESNCDSPPTMYHATKLSGEYILEQLNQYGIPVVSLRIPSPISPGMQKKTILSIFIKNSLLNKDIIIDGNGTRKQNYLDVRDVAKLIENNIGKNILSGKYCIGAEKTISNYDLAKLIIKLTNSKSKIIFSGKKDYTDNFNWRINCNKARKQLRFLPQFTIEDSLLDIIKNTKEEQSI